MSRYVIVVDLVTPEQTNALTSFVKAQNVAYWHWLVSAWLIVDASGNTDRDSVWWRDKFRDLLPVTANVLVLNADTGVYAAFAPKESHEWLDKIWGKGIVR